MRAITALRACTRVPWLGVLAVESRTRPARGGAALAEHAAWVAQNALAACGRWVRCDRALAAAAGDAHVVHVDGTETWSLLAALAAIPALPVGTSLSRRARVTLRLLGIPVVDVAAPGTRVIVGDGAFVAGPSLRVAVQHDPTGYLVGLSGPSLPANV